MTTRRLRSSLCLLVVVLALTAGAAAPAGAGDDPDATDATTTTTAAFDDGDQRIIPRPDSGHEPEDAGDRGGALQLGLLALIVVGVGVVGVKVFRQTRQVSR